MCAVGAALPPAPSLGQVQGPGGGAGGGPRRTQFSLLQPAEQFNGQGASFNGGSVSYSQPGLSGVRADGREAHGVGT